MYWQYWYVQAAFLLAIGCVWRKAMFQQGEVGCFWWDPGDLTASSYHSMRVSITTRDIIWWWIAWWIWSIITVFPSSRNQVSIFEEGTVIIWDTKNGNQLKLIQAHQMAITRASAAEKPVWDGLGLPLAAQDHRYQLSTHISYTSHIKNINISDTFSWMHQNQT